MGDVPPIAPPISPLRIDIGQPSPSSQSQPQSQSPAVGAALKVKLDIRDVVRREAYRPELNERVRREEFRGTSREEERSMRRGAFWNHVNKGVAYSWVSDHGLVVSDEEMALAFKYFRGGEGVGKLNEYNVWPKLKVAPNAPTPDEFAGFDLFEGDNASWEGLHKLLDVNDLEDYDPVREAFLLIDENRSGVMSRAQVKEMAEKWGIGDITEEDVDDLFRATGVNPHKQTSITLNEYRDLIRTDLSNKEGVRVKLVDQIVEQPLVLVNLETQRHQIRGGSPTKSRGTPTGSGSVTARTLQSLMLAHTRPTSASSRPTSATPAVSTPSRSTPEPLFTPSTPTQRSTTHSPSPTRAVRPSSPIKVAIPASTPTRANMPSPTRSTIPTTSPTRVTRPQSPFPTSPPARPISPSRPATATRPVTPARPTTPARPATPVRSVSPTRPVSPVRAPTLNSMRPASPAPPRTVSPTRARSQPSSPVHSSAPAKPSFTSSTTSPTKASPSNRSRSASPVVSTGPYPHTARIIQANKEAKESPKKSKSEKPSVAFAELPEKSEKSDDEEESKPVVRSTSRKLDRIGSTGSMKINLALKKAEEILRKDKEKSAANAPQQPAMATPAIPTPAIDATAKSFDLLQARLKSDMYNSSKEIDKYGKEKKKSDKSKQKS